MDAIVYLYHATGGFSLACFLVGIIIVRRHRWIDMKRRGQGSMLDEQPVSPTKLGWGLIMLGIASIIFSLLASGLLL